MEKGREDQVEQVSKIGEQFSSSSLFIGYIAACTNLCIKLYQMSPATPEYQKKIIKPNRGVDSTCRLSSVGPLKVAKWSKIFLRKTLLQTFSSLKPTR